MQASHLSINTKIDLFCNLYIRNKQSKKVLYVHTPFCVKKCRYCVYSSIVPSNSSEIEGFISDVLPKQICAYRKILENTKFDQIYFGGGTPTILTVSQMEEIFKMIPNFDNVKTKCIEASPSTLSAEHIKLLQKYKFNFISVGIQSLDPHIQTLHNRKALSKKELAELSKLLTTSGIYFNYDMICYLIKGDLRDLREFYDEICFILEYCKPTSITIHQQYQAIFTIEKTKHLVRLINKVLMHFTDYECINSLLSEENNELALDTIYQAEYRLVQKKSRSFSHYMWNKYASLPVMGYDVLSLGYIDQCHTTSNVGNVVLNAIDGRLSCMEPNNTIIDECQKVRAAKGV